MHISTLVPLLAALAGASAAAVVPTENHVQVARAPAPAVQLQANEFTRVQSRDKDPGDEWGGWGTSSRSAPYRFEFKKGYTKESFTLTTYAATWAWFADSKGGWIDESGPEPTPEHTLHCTIEAPKGGLKRRKEDLIFVVSNKEPYISPEKTGDVKASCEMEA